MPGSIQVSVLNFNGSQSSSSTTQMSLNVSMGKREHQTWDKGDFSFPVTTLRDNLIVTLLDAEGNELSHTSLETRLVIEKGTWEDTFFLEGGGQVHMKLQFVLNDEDRQRIRTMRESALRKKHEELLNSEVRRPEHATKAGSDVASSRHRNHEVSDPEKSSLPDKLDQDGLTSPEGKFGADDGERTDSIEKKMKPNDTDRYERISSASPATERFDVQLKKVNSGNLNGKGAVGAFQNDSPIRKVFPEESVGISGSTVSSKGKNSFKQEDGATAPGNQGSEQKPPSKVRNMISALEGSHNQDIRPKTGTLPIKSQSSKTGVNFPEGLYSDKFKAPKVKSGDSFPWTVRDAQNIGNVKPTPTPVRNEEEPLDSSATQVQTIGKNVDLKDKVKAMHKELNEADGKMCFEHSTRLSAGKKTTVSGRVHYDQRYSGNNLVGKINKNGSQEKGSQNLDIQEYCRDGMFSAEHSGAWIFPGERKHFCITTGGIQLMNFIETCQAAAKSLPGIMGSFVGGNLTEPIENVANEVESRNGETSSQRPTNPETDGSPNGENPRGLLGQVVRVAIVVGFATLVIFTRQRSPDPKKAKEAKSTE